MLRAAQQIFILALILSKSISAEAKDVGTKMYFSSIDSSFNGQHIKNFQIDIYKNRQSINVSCELEKDFPQDHWMAIVFSTKNRKSSAYRILFQSDNNICELVDNKRPSLLTPVAQSIWKIGKFPKCPVPKGYYSWRNLKGMDLNFPSIFDGQYKLQVQFYFRRNPQKDSILNMTALMVLK